jgi:hypothetical protein
MRKIGSATERKRKNKRNQVILGIGLVIVMLFSIVGFSFQSGNSGNTNVQETKIYKGYTFSKVSDLWVTELGAFQFIFSNFPDDVPKIPGNVKFIDEYANEPLYVASEKVDAGGEIVLNLRQIAQRVQPACFEGKLCEDDLPIKTCEDNLIVISVGEENSIVQEDNCVFITGIENQLLKVVDEFLLKIIGVE